MSKGKAKGKGFI